MHDGRQLREHIRVRLWGIRIPPHPDLNHAQPQRPDIRRDGVRPEVVLGLAFDALRCHVGLTPDVSLGEGFLKLAGDAEIAEFDLAFLVDEDVGGFHVCDGGYQYCVQ